jgi:hypothetical protein
MELQEALKLLKYISENDITEKEYIDMLDSKEAKLINGYIEELQERIEKAIEYIENNKYDFEKWETQMLLDILKGNDKE